MDKENKRRSLSSPQPFTLTCEEVLEILSKKRSGETVPADSYAEAFYHVLFCPSCIEELGKSDKGNLQE